MTFLAVLIVYLLLHWWRASCVIQHDQWFYNLVAAFRRTEWLAKYEGAVLAASIACPMLAVVLLSMLVQNAWSGFGLLVAVPVLLYSIGRGRFKANIATYLQALKDEDWSKAVAVTKTMTCQPVGEGDCKVPDSGSEQANIDQASASQASASQASASQANNCQINVEEGDWAGLHHQFLYAASYRGFERVFAVLFWFVLLGPMGALMYRLSALFLTQMPDDDNNTDSSDESNEKADLARRWLWLLEWPAARVLGVSYAVTGNFMGCLRGWYQGVFNTQISSHDFLGNCVKGALTIDEDEEVSEQVEERQVRWLQSLLSRTLIFWMSVLAILTIIV